MLSKPIEPRIACVRTNTRDNDVNCSIVKEEFREYNTSKKKYVQYNNVSRCLVKFIIVVVLNIYLQELCDMITKFGNIELHVIIKHLQDNYGTISVQDLDTNDKRRKTIKFLPDPIEILFNRLFDGKHFAEKAGDTMEDSVLTRIGYNTIADNGLFQQACYEWRKLSKVQQSWPKSKTDFTVTDKGHVNNKKLLEAGDHNTNNATTDIYTVTTLGNKLILGLLVLYDFCAYRSHLSTDHYESRKFHKNAQHLEKGR